MSMGFRRASSLVVVHRFSCPATRIIFQDEAGGCLITGPPGKSQGLYSKPGCSFLLLVMPGSISTSVAGKGMVFLDTTDP